MRTCLSVLSALVLFAGCAAAPLDRREKAFLRGVAEAVRELRESGEHPALRGFRGKLTGNFFSHAYNREPRAGMPMFNRNLYWFKVSLAEKPVETFDSPQPLLTMRIPKFGKFLKLRVRGKDGPLTRALAETVLRAGTEAGGEDPRWGRLEDVGAGPPRVGRRGRFF